MSESQWLRPSEKAMAVKDSRFVPKYKFPFDEVPAGFSFPVGIDQVKNIAVLRTLATREGVKLNRRFRVIDHGDQGYEVFHIGER